ncbi:hypothetical protein GCM10027184_72320 [Saccharothrix stipae]
MLAALADVVASSATPPVVVAINAAASATRDTDLAVSFIFDTFAERHPSSVTGELGITVRPVRRRRVAGCGRRASVVAV